MSINSREINFVGKIFESENEILRYLLKKKIINEVQLKEYLQKLDDDEGSLEDIVEIKHITNFPRIEMIDYCLGEGLFLGYRITTDFRQGASPEKYVKEVNDAKENWVKIFDDKVDVESVTQYS